MISAEKLQPLSPEFPMLLGTSTQATNGLRTSTKNIPSLENLTASCQRTIDSPAMDIFGIVFFTLALGLMAYVTVIEVRFFTRRLRSTHWPTTTAIIRPEWVASLGRGGRGVFFTYDFVVQGSTHHGRFALLPLTSEDQGRKLLGELSGLPISIRYNPKRPEVSFLVNHLYDARFDGVSATQNPYWYMERREIPGETIDLLPK
jgi:hypothetical protein